jgi:hypothetical protein
MRRLAVILLAAAAAVPASARFVGVEPVQYSPEVHDWIRALKAPGQVVACCDFNDGDFAQQDIRTGADGGQHWFTTIRGEWFEVPDEAVVTEPNLLGRPIVWYWVTPLGCGPLLSAGRAR